MDRKDIIRILADLDPVSDAGLASLSIETLERFAALIAAAEREECAKLCEESPERLDSDGCWRASQQACADAIRAREQS
jgi:hypothetical protein